MFLVLFDALFPFLIKSKATAMSESTNDQASSSKAASSSSELPKKFPKGVVLGKDGKP